MLEEALLGAVLSSARQAGQVDQDGDLLVLSLGRQVQIEGHLAASGSGIVAQLEQLTAEGGNGSLGGDGHDEGWMLDEMRQERPSREMDDDGPCYKSELTFLRGVFVSRMRGSSTR